MQKSLTQIYGVSLPQDVAYRARIVAAMQGRSRSGLMRDLLVDYLEKCDPSLLKPTGPHPQPLQLLQAAGM